MITRRTARACTCRDAYVHARARACTLSLLGLLGPLWARVTLCLSDRCPFCRTDNVRHPCATPSRRDNSAQWPGQKPGHPGSFSGLSPGDFPGTPRYTLRLTVMMTVSQGVPGCTWEGAVARVYREGVYSPEGAQDQWSWALLEETRLASRAGRLSASERPPTISPGRARPGLKDGRLLEQRPSAGNAALY